MTRSEEDSSRIFHYIGEQTVYFFSAFLAMQLFFVLISKNRGKCSHSLWQNFMFQQFLHWTPLINVADEYFFQQMGQVLRPFQLQSICQNEKINNSNYNNAKIYWNGFVNNAGPLIMIWASFLIGCASVLRLSKQYKYSWLLGIRDKVKFSAVIRLNLIFFTDFIVLSMIDLNFYRFTDVCSVVNFTISVVLILVSLFSLIFLPYIIEIKLKNRKNLTLDAIFANIKTITDEFKPLNEFITYQYYSIFLLNRFSVAFSLIFLSRSNQIFIMIIFQLICSNFYIVFYLLMIRPFKKRTDALTVLFYEFLCLLLLIFIGLLLLLSLNSNAKLLLTSLCVLTIWTIEIIILIRFIINLCVGEHFPKVIDSESLESEQSNQNGKICNSINEEGLEKSNQVVIMQGFHHNIDITVFIKTEIKENEWGGVKCNSFVSTEKAPVGKIENLRSNISEDSLNLMLESNHKNGILLTSLQQLGLNEKNLKTANEESNQDQ